MARTLFDRLKQRPGAVALFFIIAALAVAVIARGPASTRRPVPPTPPRMPGEEPTLRVYFHDDGQVHTMKFEEYLLGVVAGEMDPHWPVEALGAQAIIARTFTLRKVQEGGVRRQGTDASTDPAEFQAYDASAITANVRQAVEQTRGQVITYRGNPVLAWYHASSGGKTATPQEGLGFREEPTPYIQVVRDLPQTRDVVWRATFSREEIGKAASALGFRVGEVRSIRIGRKGPSGRAMTIIINGRSLPAPELRLALGPEKMRSTLLDELRMTGNRVTMQGKGFGHGVGMSQWGARVMAAQGKDAEEIVGFYYRGVSIEQFWK